MDTASLLPSHPISETDLDASLADLTGQLSPSSQRIYRLDAKAFADWMIEGGLTPQTLTRSDMIAYRAYLQGRYAKATASRRLVVARRLLAEQVHRGHIATNPASDVKGFKVANETTHLVLTQQEAQRLLEAIDTRTLLGQRDAALILLLLRTGIRRSEAAALLISDCTMEQGHHIAIIRHGKGDKRRIVKVPVDVHREITAYVDALRGYHSAALSRESEALNQETELTEERRRERRETILQRHRMTTDDPLFVSFRRGDHPTRRPMGDKAIETQVKTYAKKAGLDRLTPHGLRATFITLALENNAKLQQVQYAAGHSDPRTTERYQARKTNLDDNAVDYVKVSKRR